MSNPRKIAVVLFNMGGPDKPEAVEPFLRNLFSDPAMLRMPGFLRNFLAKRIARRRAPIAQKIYAAIGGRSPILPNTVAQAKALEAELADYGAVRAFVAMRYWHPFSAEVVAEIDAFQPDQMILLPLYPQFSTTTTASSLTDFQETVQKARGDLQRRWGKALKVATVCCYPTDTGFIRAMTLAIRAAYPAALAHGQPRLLFSAHGIPEKYRRAGDPYVWQCEQTAAALARDIGIPGLDWVLCYQSRVGPLQWVGPSVDDEVIRAGRDGVPVIIVPVAFVSDHSETLYEIEIEYRHLAQESGVPHFTRIPAAGTAPDFITGLGRLVRKALVQETPLTSASGVRICPQECSGCLCQ